MTIETSHTFDTEAEAQAFLLGFHLNHPGIFCVIDAEEPNTVLIDFEDTDEGSAEEAESYYLETIANLKQIVESNTVCPEGTR